jgi:diguanylate cyclase (GGDEF)-like protein
MPLFADSAIWVAVGLAIGAAALGLAISAAMTLSYRRSRRDTSTDAAAREASRSPTEAMVAELAGALEQARAESRRSRRRAEIASTIDLDGVLERTLAAAAELSGVDAAMIALPEEPEPLVATVGMTAEEAARQSVSPTGGESARAVRVDHHDDQAEQAEAKSSPIRGGIAVPLRNAEEEPVGTLAVFWRGSARAAADEELAELEELAASCGPAIGNAQRFREARRLADFDALTNLHNRRYFHETLAREWARADRYERRLSLIVVDVDDFKAINDRIGHLAGDSVLATVAERLRSAVRRADVPCRVGGDEFAVILPEASLADAEQLYRRIRFEVASRPIGPAHHVSVSAGIAELGPADDAVALFQRADEALFRAKEAGKGQVRAAGSPGAPGQG